MTRHRRFACAAALLLAGCAGSHTFTERNSGQTVDVDLGTTFSLSIHRPPGSQNRPSFEGSILEAVGQRSPTSGLIEFEFRARGLGETEIRILPDFSLRVRVVSSGDRPGMHLNH